MNEKVEECIKLVRAWESAIPDVANAITDIEVRKLYRPHPNVLEFLVAECGMERVFATEMLEEIRSRN